MELGAVSAMRLDAEDRCRFDRALRRERIVAVAVSL
jgi:hypothetical protein